MTDHELDFDDLDRMSRTELAEWAHKPYADIASTLDEWLSREHGVYSSSHGVGLFLDLLADHGLSVVRDEVPPLPESRPTSAEEATRHRERTSHRVTDESGQWRCLDCETWEDGDSTETDQPNDRNARA